MAIGAEVALVGAASIGTVGVRTTVRRGVDLAALSRRHDDWWGSCGSGRARGGGVLTDVAVRLVGEARTGFRLVAALAPWWRGVRWCRVSNCTVAWPYPMEHEALPHKRDQHQLVEKERRYHGKTSSYQC
jgi:hypothetical protein